MDSTPHSSQDSANMSFDQSTPLVQHNLRKRKISFLDQIQKLTDFSGFSSSTPKFSSTLNESLTEQLSLCHIENEQPNKVFVNSAYQAKKIHSAPNTPEKQVKTRNETIKRPNSHIKLCPQESPLHEARSILYPNLKPLTLPRKLSSPLSLKNKPEKSPARKRLFPTNKDLLAKILTNNLIMKKVFDNLSDGDLYRCSMVSKSFRDALITEPHAYNRYATYKVKHRKNKENYKITPPASPEKMEYDPPSPNSRNFRHFADRAKSLDKHQSLIKCPKCNNPSIVDNNIAQCESLYCGYIYCQKCESHAYKVEDFHDNCNSAVLTRSTFSDLSNTTDHNSSLSFFNNSQGGNTDSGFYSSFESVKRNLSASFSTPKILGSNSNRVAEKPKLWRRNSSIASVIKVKDDRVNVKVMEPPSPPKVNPYVACSKQSKRNLKRLTR